MPDAECLMFPVCVLAMPLPWGSSCAGDSLADFTVLSQGFAARLHARAVCTQCTALMGHHNLESLRQGWAPTSSCVSSMGARQQPCVGLESHCPDRGTAKEVGQLRGGQKRFSLGCFLLFLLPISFSLQQPRTWLCTASTGMPRGWQMPHCWSWKRLHRWWEVFCENHFCTFLGFWALTNVLETTLIHSIPKSLSTELLSASLLIFCWDTNNIFLPPHPPPTMHLLLAKPMNWPLSTWLSSSPVKEMWLAGLTFCWIPWECLAASDEHACWSSHNNTVSSTLLPHAGFPYLFHLQNTVIICFMREDTSGSPALFSSRCFSTGCSLISQPDR